MGVESEKYYVAAVVTRCHLPRIFTYPSTSQCEAIRLGELLKSKRNRGYEIIELRAGTIYRSFRKPKNGTSKLLFSLPEGLIRSDYLLAKNAPLPHIVELVFTEPLPQAK